MDAPMDAPPTFEEHFGACDQPGPEGGRCLGCDGPYHAGKDNYYACHEHRTVWFGGNTFMSSQTDDEEQAHFEPISGYRMIEHTPPAETPHEKRRRRTVQAIERWAGTLDDRAATLRSATSALLWSTDGMDIPAARVALEAIGRLEAASHEAYRTAKSIRVAEQIPDEPCPF